jgi:glutathione-regulated potassium-efflux system ancillary protein KefC
VTETWLLAAVWIGLALVAVLIALALKISTALSEIVVGTVAQLVIGAFVGTEFLGAKAPWIVFLAGAGAILLTFLAGAELDPTVFRSRWKDATLIGLVGFTAPFIGGTALARYVLHWAPSSSWLAGVALSTTSVAVVYAVMLELGLNKTDFGKIILAACFINDLGTVIALGLIFSPFTRRTIIFVLSSIAIFAILPWLTPRFFKKFGGRVSELEAKYLLLLLFGLGGLAAWAGSEAVLPAYLIGMVLAGTVGKDHALIRRLRTLIFGLLTPFYFIRAGSFVSVPALVAAPLVFLALFFAKSISKFVGVFPVTKFLKYPRQEGIYTTLMMSTGLTFGTISALFGLSHGIINGAQYSYIVATVIATAVVPTVIANALFLPKHHLPIAVSQEEAAEVEQAAEAEAERIRRVAREQVLSTADKLREIADQDLRVKS